MIKFLQFVNSTVSKLRLYYSHVPKFLEFEIPKGAFLVFSVLNAKKLDANGVRAYINNTLTIIITSHKSMWYTENFA